MTLTVEYLTSITSLRIFSCIALGVTMSAYQVYLSSQMEECARCRPCNISCQKLEFPRCSDSLISNAMHFKADIAGLCHPCSDPLTPNDVTMAMPDPTMAWRLWQCGRPGQDACRILTAIKGTKTTEAQKDLPHRPPLGHHWVDYEKAADPLSPLIGQVSERSGLSSRPINPC